MNKILGVFILGIFMLSFTSAITWDNSAYYEMENTSVIDSSGNGNTGTNSGTNVTTGKVNNALDFESSESDYINLTTALLPTDTSDYTINLWVNFESTAVGEVGLVTQYVSGNPGRYIFGTVSGTNQPRVFLGGNSVSSSTDLGTNTWSMVTVTRESGNTSIWINGSHDTSSASLSGALVSAKTQLGVFGASNYLDAKLDEVAFWDRSINQTDISNLFNGGNGVVFNQQTNYTIIAVTPSGYDYYETETDLIYLNTTIINQTNSLEIQNISLYTNEDGNFNIYDTIDLSSGSYKSYSPNFTYYPMNLEGDVTWGIEVCSDNNLCETSNFTIDYNPIVFTQCNATYSNDFLNISFKDEADLSILNATIPYSSFEYYLGNGSLTKTYEFTNNSVNYDYTFCASPTDRTFYVDPFVQYKNGTQYPQRVWDDAVQTYTSTVTKQILYLLSTIDGQQVTFQVLNPSDQPISGVAVTAVRQISGSDVTVGFGTTSSAGLVSFFLNPDFSHDFTFTKSGLTTYETTFFPTETEYTIVMGTPTATQNNSFRGISYSTIPQLEYLENDTSYTFGFNLTSSYWDISEYGFNLRLANGTIITGDTTTTEGTELTKAFNTSNESIIYMDYYWIINGNYTNASRYWIVHNTEYQGFSLKQFFTDLNSYIDSGIFGLDNFGRNLIVFFIMLITVGIFSYKYGITNPIGLTAMIFTIVFFFDVVVGLIPTIRNISNLPTFIMGLILTLVVLNEVRLR